MKRCLVAALLVATGGGCKHAAGGGGAPDLAPAPAFAAHDKVDVLFMVDNSNGEPYKSEFRARFPQFIKALDDAALTANHRASYHFGVVTSDLGAGPYTTACAIVGGEGGKLQTGAPNSSSVPPPANCASFTLGGGVRFLDYDQIAGTNNAGGGLSVADAFDCMASVGDQGCGFEHQLESTYRALHDDIPENAGFLRDDALLVIFYVTDEDDCSAPPDGALFDPSPDGVAKYGVVSSFRCTQFGITCSDPPGPLDGSSAMGPFTNCRPLTQAEGGQLFDVQRYIDFFTRPGGVKADPSDVILGAISAPPTPFGWSLTMPCQGQPNAPSCPVLDHSCLAPANAAFFGDPAVRLTAVVNSALTSTTWSLCDTDYSGALADLAQKIIARLK